MKLGLYKHYKGNPYNLMGLARHSESLEEMVVYQAMYGDYRLWVRPKELFFGTLMVDGQEVPRFTFVDETLTQTPLIR